MKDIIRNAALLITLIVTACSTPPEPPLIIDGKLLIPTGQTLMVPAGGILFSNGAMIGGAQ